MQSVPEASGEGKMGDPWTVSFLVGNVEIKRQVPFTLTRGDRTCLWKS